MPTTQGGASLTADEQARRRAAFRDALAQVRLEGMEPDPAFFEYEERYCRGELTIDEAVADFLAQSFHTSAAQ